MKITILVVFISVCCVSGLAQKTSRPKAKGAISTNTAPKTTSSNKPSVAANTGVAPISSSTVNCTESTGLTQTETEEILAEHNKARAELKLPLLTWDCKLAGYAQEWAARGVAKHRDTNYGESIFVSSNGAEPIGSVVAKWLGEKPFWDNSKAACQPRKICTHYTQTVWRWTTKVGCAINRGATGNWKALVVCNYDPAGNYDGPAW